MLDQIDPIYLEGLPLFKDFTSRQLVEAAKLLQLNVFPAGHHLISRDAPGDAIFIVRKGTVKVCASTPDEQFSVVHIGGVGAVFGEMAVMDGRTRSATVVTLEESVVYTISRQDFWSTLWEIPPVPYNLSCLLNSRLRLVTEQMQALKHLDDRGRVVRQLASLFEELGKASPEAPGQTQLPFHLDLSDLASLCGVPLEDTKHYVEGWLTKGALRVSDEGYLVARDLNSMGE